MCFCFLRETVTNNRSPDLYLSDKCVVCPVPDPCIVQIHHAQTFSNTKPDCTWRVWTFYWRYWTWTLKFRRASFGEHVETLFLNLPWRVYVVPQVNSTLVSSETDISYNSPTDINNKPTQIKLHFLELKQHYFVNVLLLSLLRCRWVLCKSQLERFIC